MPYKRRRHTGLFAKSHRRHRTNPRRRHVRHHHSKFAIANRTRRVNRYRRHHYRRNPAGLGVSGSVILNYAGAGIGLSIAQPIVNRLIGGILPLGQYNGPAITAITGWGLGHLFNMLPDPIKRLSQPAMILGLSTAVIQIVQPFVSNLISGATTMAAPPAPPTMSGWPQGYSGWTRGRIGAMRRHPMGRRMMRGIGVTTGIPPTITAPPAPPAPVAPSQQGSTGSMHGIGVRPGVWAY